MKKKLYIVFALCSLLLIPGCKEEGADLRPGLYVDTELIDAFAGKQINLSGQASCYTGLQSMNFRCEAWGINDTTDLSNQKPVVWNFDYSFVVPDDAEFPQDLIITATDVHGTQMKRAVTMRYSPATTAPYIDGLKEQIAIEFDEAAGKGVCDLKATLFGQDAIREVKLEIPAIGIDTTYELNTREYEFKFKHTFEALGTYSMMLTVTDNSGNTTLGEYQLIVMKPEPIDAIEDYPYLWAFKEEDNNQYLEGFFKYTRRLDSYTYEVIVYSEDDKTGFFFSPTQQMEGDRKFGESPFVKERIVSVQTQPGYVQAYKPGKGYWALYLDLKEKTIEKKEYNTAGVYNSELYLANDNGLITEGTQFTQLNKINTDYQYVLDATFKTTFPVDDNDRWYMFTSVPGWSNVSYWRPWLEENLQAGWWYDATGESKTGSLTFPLVSSDTDVSIYFDAAIQWCWIIKK